MLKVDDVTAFNLVTYSIVARDPDSGEIGAAVATHWPGVGAVVPWVEPGVGGVATQSFTNVALGSQGLALLRDGLPAPDALRELVSGDADRDVRQVGLVDASGRSAAHTGSRCVAEAGHVCESDVSVQANMLERAEVWLSMLDAFRRAGGDLADRLMAALRAGERGGGDLRGTRSVALIVTSGSSDARSWDRRFDLRVDASGQPIDELARLLRIARAYEALDAAIEAVQLRQLETALASTSVAHELAPDDAQVAFWHAMVLFASDRPDEARPLLEAALLVEPRLAEFGQRLAEAGHAGPLASAMLALHGPDGR